METKEEIINDLKTVIGSLILDENFCLFKITGVDFEEDKYMNVLVTKRKWVIGPKYSTIQKRFVFGKVTVKYKSHSNENGLAVHTFRCHSLEKLADLKGDLFNSWVRFENLKSDLITFKVIFI